MKYEYKKQEKELYGPTTVPQVVKVPKQKFICIKGQGNPNNSEFGDKVGALYQAAYAIRMMPRNGYTPDGYFEYTVYPLEGIWDLTDEGRKSKVLNKDYFAYTIMIKQPNFVTKEVFNKALEIARKKKPNKLLDELYFEEAEEGLCLQILHNGSYDDEPSSFALMHEYLEANNYVRESLTHKEIYLTDARKTPKEKQKTILRIKIKNK